MKLYRWLLLLLMSGAVQLVSGQQTTILANGWEWLRQDLSSAWEAVRPVPKPDAPESVPLWQPVQLPHCANVFDAVDPSGNYYQGAAWYRTRLSVNNPYPNGRTLLHFDGAGQTTEVYINTTLVARHVGGYDGFDIDITNAVESFRKDPAAKRFEGKIPLSIRTDNSRNTQRMPSSLSDFTIYNGLYRPVQLVYQPVVFIREVQITPSLVNNKDGKLDAVIFLSDHSSTGSRKQRMKLRVYAPSGELVSQTEKEVTGSMVSLTFSLSNVQRWSLDTPSCYTMQVELVQEKEVLNKTNTRFGFRKIEFVQHGPMLLNGQRLLLKGTHRHEDHAGVGAAMTETQMRDEMISIKAMGVNFIRLGHYQQASLIPELCDSLGILVWEEIPWCRGGLGDTAYRQQGHDMLRNMITQHYNHPSVIIWGLGNENDWPGDFPVFDTLAIRSYMRSLNDLAHRMDPSRSTAIRRCDFCKDIPDIYSPSIWAGWYRGIYTDYRAFTIAEEKKVNHFLHVEWGGDSHAGRHSEKPDRLLTTALLMKDPQRKDSLWKQAASMSKDNTWNESYICNLVDWHLKEQETMPWLPGTAAWTFKDFATPLRPGNPIPYVNQKGVVTRDGTRKESYYVFQSYWASAPMVHIYGHGIPVRWGESGEVKVMKVYSNCDEVELFVNGKSWGKKRRDVQDYPATGFHWILPFQQGDYSLRAVGRKGNTEITDTLSFHYVTNPGGTPAQLVMKTEKRSGDTVRVSIQLLDTAGNRCLESTNRIHFSLSGNGQLIENRGTPGGSNTIEVANGVAFIDIVVRGLLSVNATAATASGQPFLSQQITLQHDQ